jgi:hypothetical protein
MKEKVSIAKLVFRRIAEIWRTIPIEEVAYPTENIHRSTVKKVAGNSKSGFQRGGKWKHEYDTIKNLNCKAEVLGSCFIK